MYCSLSLMDTKDMHSMMILMRMMMMTVVFNIGKAYNKCVEHVNEQARKPRSYASPKLRLTDSLTGVKSLKCRATSVAKNHYCFTLPRQNENYILVCAGSVHFLLLRSYHKSCKDLRRRYSCDLLQCDS